jgi:hypothetical protein
MKGVQMAKEQQKPPPPPPPKRLIREGVEIVKPSKMPQQKKGN